MKYDCEMIADLLPLYKDGACSQASVKIIDEHLAECTKCKNILDKMNDNYIDEEIVKEKEEVINSQAKFFKRKSAVAGSIVAAVFAIPILICLIVDLAGGAGLGWFFIVLAAMFIPTSLVVVPLMVPKYRMMSTMGAFAFSVVFLLGVCCLYSRGSWFFIAASAVLFGLTICFAPFFIFRNPVKRFLRTFKGLTLISAYTLMFVIMILCIGFTISSPGFFAKAFGISLPIIAVIWLVFLVCRYLPLNGFLKAGICIAIVTTFGFFSVDIIDSFIGAMDNSSNAVVVSSSMSSIELIVGLAAGALFAIIGIVVMIAGKKKGEE